jgi:precorrin-2 C20-methyltransferase/precorrin-3B C17-methyltransferase
VDRLGSFDTGEVDMRCLLIIGSTRTRVRKQQDGTSVVWTPRSY